jgi:uracil-DNA glycosylase
MAVTAEQKAFLERWSSCQSCGLGKTREERIVKDLRGLQNTPSPVLATPSKKELFVLAGPVGEVEEATSEAWRSDKYRVLKEALEVLGISYHLSHSLPCRPCAAQKEADGSLVLRKGLPVWRDVEPPVDAYGACRGRALEEIYLVDPLLILMVGTTASRVLGVKAAAEDRGKVFTVKVPGKTTTPSLTPKGAWGRKVRGEFVRPTIPYEVDYPALLTVSLEDVHRYQGSTSVHREPMQFVKDLKYLKQMFNLYRRLTDE